jgi:endoglucanase
VLGENPKLLVAVQGVAYSGDLTGPYTLPVQLSVPNRVVYSPHDYAWFHDGLASAADLKSSLGNAWGYLLTQNQTYTAPVWVGEFGTCHGDPSCLDGASGAGLWYSAFRSYLAEADIDWAYWALNGTEASGTTRTLGAEDTYGILNATWSAPASAPHLATLTLLQAVTQAP